MDHHEPFNATVLYMCAVLNGSLSTDVSIRERWREETHTHTHTTPKRYKQDFLEKLDEAGKLSSLRKKKR